MFLKGGNKIMKVHNVKLNFGRERTINRTTSLKLNNIFRNFCTTKSRTIPDDGLNLSHFLNEGTNTSEKFNETEIQAPIPYISEDPQPGYGR